MTRPSAASEPSRLQGLPPAVRGAVAAALDKKAMDVVVLDLRHAGAFTDYFVICSGQNPRQVKAIADSVEQTLQQADVRPAHVEGYQHAEWILIDCFDFVVHVFNRETRLFYALDRLWGSVPRLAVSGHDSNASSGAAASWPPHDE